MQKNIADGAVILKKNSNYNSVQEAEIYYEKQRLTQLSVIKFPEEEYADGFKEILLSLMKFQNPVQMNVWHNKTKGLVENGERMATTWETMSNHNLRPFQCAEVFQCLEILKRATPNELFEYVPNDFVVDNLKNSNNEIILKYFNDIAYPKIEKIVQHLEKVLFEIEEQVCAPIRAKINADLKVMCQMSVGSNMEFIKARERKM